MQKESIFKAVKDLQYFLIRKFRTWRPSLPHVVDRTKCDITLSLEQDSLFNFLSDQFLYRVEKKNKIPPWIVVYSGGKTTKTIDNLPPSHPHKFRLMVILKAEAIPTLADKALEHFGSEAAVYKAFGDDDEENNVKVDGSGDKTCKVDELGENKWLESQYSEVLWTSTDTDGTSAVCFSMAVRCGYIKQLQVMLEERPSLIGILNPSNGFTPLATAVRKGDISTVRYLLSMGADVNQTSGSGQSPLHLAVLAGNVPLVEVLIEQGANLKAIDLNHLRVEHYAVDSGSLEMLRYILDRGGDITVRDSNGWTPLFRAITQGSKTELVEELVLRGSNIAAVDRAGLPLVSAAKVLKNRLGRNRDSILRLVDTQYPHDKALANFTRLTKKISNVHSLLK